MRRTILPVSVFAFLLSACDEGDDASASPSPSMEAIADTAVADLEGTWIGELIEPALPEGDAALGWSFCIDTDPSSAPVGFPFATLSAPCEFIVHTRWEGAKLFGLLIDRRPLLEDRSARKLPFDPILEGDAIRITVPAASLDDPTAFEWSMFTEELGPFETNIGYRVDEVPFLGLDDPIAWSAG